MIRFLVVVTCAVGCIALAACGGSGGKGGGSSGSGMCAMSCGDALGSGGEPCASDSAGVESYNAVTLCVSRKCPTECAKFLSEAAPLTSSCLCSDCLRMFCDAEVSGCYQT
jgi:hypothetical protein